MKQTKIAWLKKISTVFDRNRLPADALPDPTDSEPPVDPEQAATNSGVEEGVSSPDIYQRDEPDTAKLPDPISATTAAKNEPTAAKTAPSQRRDLIRQQAAEKHQKKQIRRQIRDEFFELMQITDDDIGHVTKFLSKYQDNLDLMCQMLAPYRHSPNPMAASVWKYLSHYTDAAIDSQVHAQIRLYRRVALLEAHLPNPVEIIVSTSGEGPIFAAVTHDELHQVIGRHLATDDFQLYAPPVFSKSGDYGIKLQFPEEDPIGWTVRLVLEPVELPTDCVSILNESPLPIPENEDVIPWLRQSLEEVLRENNLEYFPLLSQVLRTAYTLGYWKSPWVQSVLQEWRSQREDYENLQFLSSRRDISEQTLLSPAERTLKKAETYVLQRVKACQLKGDLYTPTSTKKLEQELLNHTSKSDHEVATWLLQLAKVLYMQGDKQDLRDFVVAKYCYLQGKGLYDTSKRAESRPYLLYCITLHSQGIRGYNEGSSSEFFTALVYYFGTHNFMIDIDLASTEIGDRFYTSWFTALSKPIQSKANLGALGRSLIEIATANFRFISDLLNRMKFKRGTEVAQANFALALQEQTVFSLNPSLCLELMSRLEPKCIALAFARLNLSRSVAGVDDRRLVTLALLRYANTHTDDLDSFLEGFETQASSTTKTTLAFSLLVEPFVLGAGNNEGALKAKLIAQMFGLALGKDVTERFIGTMTGIANAFDKFASSVDPHVKGGYGYNILDIIRRTRRYLLEWMPPQEGDDIIRLFRSVEAYVASEQAKLIHDTKLSIVLMNDRAPLADGDTRITVEIRNIGEGTALGLELEIYPVKGQYDVEKRHQVQKIDVIESKKTLQVDLHIEPTVDVNSPIELHLELRYDTFKNKNKKAELAQDNRRVMLYPLTQFIRVLQPYNHGVPATTWFYGRQNTLQGMADNLQNGSGPDTSMIIYGLKRAGKTSIVKRFVEHTLEERGLSNDYIAIYGDLLLKPGRIQNNEDFLDFLIEIICDGIQERFGKPIDLTLTTSATKTGAFAVFSKRLELILTQIAPRRLLLVLDEFSELNGRIAPGNDDSGLTPEVFSFLSNTIQHTDQLTFVFTGTYILFEMIREYAVDIAKISAPYLIGFLDDNSARHLVVEPVRRNPDRPSQGWLEYDQRVVDRIVSVTNCHPYLIQYLCRQLVDRMNSLHQNVVNLRDIEEIVNDVISSPQHDGAMTLLWNEFTSPQHKILSIIAAKMRTPEDMIDVEGIAKTLDVLGSAIQSEETLRICKSLADALLLEESSHADTMAVRITIPLYQLWLKHNKGLKVVFGKQV